MWCFWWLGSFTTPSSIHQLDGRGLFSNLTNFWIRPDWCTGYNPYWHLGRIFCCVAYLVCFSVLGFELLATKKFATTLLWSFIEIEDSSIRRSMIWSWSKCFDLFSKMSWLKGLSALLIVYKKVEKELHEDLDLVGQPNCIWC